MTVGSDGTITIIGTLTNSGSIENNGTIETTSAIAKVTGTGTVNSTQYTIKSGKISAGTDENLYVIKTAKNGNKITYKDMFTQMSARDSKCLWLLARSLGDACVPGYINEK